MDGSGGVELKKKEKKSLLHLHLAVGLRAVLVLHMPETNGNKAFTRFTADTTLACTPIRLLLGSGPTWGGAGGGGGHCLSRMRTCRACNQKTPHFG